MHFNNYPCSVPQGKSLSIDKARELDMALFDTVKEILVVQNELTPIPDEGHLIYADGIYEIVNNDIGKFVFKSQDTGNALSYLPIIGKNRFELNLPKIPYKLLQIIQNFFREVSVTMQDEVMVQLFWDKVNAKYVISVPEQEVAAASISFDRSKGLVNNPDMYLVMDIHSHVNMHETFSSIDDRDEIGTQLYGVIGRLSTPGMNMTLRAGHSGSFLILDIDSVFDTSDCYQEGDIPAADPSWIGNVKKKQFGWPYTTGAQNGVWRNQNAKPRFQYQSGYNHYSRANNRLANTVPRTPAYIGDDGIPTEDISEEIENDFMYMLSNKMYVEASDSFEKIVELMAENFDGFSHRDQEMIIRTMSNGVDEMVESRSGVYRKAY